MKALGAIIVLLAYVVFIVGAVNVVLDWWRERIVKGRDIHRALTYCQFLKRPR